jgi:hypothetical protein
MFSVSCQKRGRYLILLSLGGLAFITPVSVDCQTDANKATGSQADASTTIRAYDLGRPPLDNKLEWWAKQAKAAHKTIVTVPFGISEDIGSNMGLDEALKYFDIISAMLVGEHVQVDRDYMTTWYRFKLDKVLFKHLGPPASSASIKVDKNKPPLNEGEFFVIEEGGSVKVDGVLIRQQMSSVRAPIIGQPYLLFANINPEHLALVAGSWQGMYLIDDDKLISRDKKSNVLEEELSQKFSFSLSQLSEYITKKRRILSL